MFLYHGVIIKVQTKGGETTIVSGVLLLVFALLTTSATIITLLYIDDKTRLIPYLLAVDILILFIFIIKLFN